MTLPGCTLMPTTLAAEGGKTPSWVSLPPFLPDSVVGKGKKKPSQTSSRTIILNKPPQIQAPAIRAGLSDLFVIVQLGSEDKCMY